VGFDQVQAYLICFATRYLLALLTDVSGGRIKMTRTRLIMGLITSHRTYLTITKTRKGRPRPDPGCSATDDKRLIILNPVSIRYLKTVPQSCKFIGRVFKYTVHYAVNKTVVTDDSEILINFQFCVFFFFLLL
jgi:hypothetical protein